MTEEEFNEECWFEAMQMREQMLEAAVGYLVLANVPSMYLHGIVANSADGKFQLACQVVLHQRGEHWDRLR